MMTGARKGPRILFIHRASMLSRSLFSQASKQVASMTHLHGGQENSLNSKVRIFIKPSVVHAFLEFTPFGKMPLRGI